MFAAADLKDSKVQMPKGLGQGLSARSTNIIKNATKTKGKNETDWHTTIWNALSNRLYFSHSPKTRNAHVVHDTAGKRKHAEIIPSYMRPTKSFAPKQQRCVDLLH